MYACLQPVKAFCTAHCAICYCSDIPTVQLLLASLLKWKVKQPLAKRLTHMDEYLLRRAACKASMLSLKAVSWSTDFSYMKPFSPTMARCNSCNLGQVAICTICLGKSGRISLAASSWDNLKRGSGKQQKLCEVKVSFVSCAKFPNHSGRSLCCSRGK